jgi:hypothetical protein
VPDLFGFFGHRQFRNDAVYRQGRVITSGRIRRAVDNGSAFGRDAAFGIWLALQPNECNDVCAGGCDLDFLRHGLKRDRSDVARIASGASNHICTPATPFTRSCQVGGELSGRA